MRDKLPLLERYELAVIANVWGRTVAEYVAVAERLDRVSGVHALELNISCPNIKQGGISFGKDPEATYEVTAAVRAATRKPLWVKLAPGVTDVTAIARAAERVPTPCQRSTPSEGWRSTWSGGGRCWPRLSVDCPGPLCSRSPSVSHTKYLCAQACLS